PRLQVLVGPTGPSGGLDLTGEGTAYVGEVDDPRVEHVQRRDSRDVWFELPALHGGEGFGGDTIQRATALQLVETRPIGGVVRDHHLAAHLMDDAAVAAIVDHRATARTAQSRLVGAGLVVDAR